MISRRLHIFVLSFLIVCLDGIGRLYAIFFTFIIGDLQFQNISIIKARWIFQSIIRKAFNIKANVWIVIVSFWNQIHRIWEMMEHCHKMFAGQVIINPFQTLTKWHSTVNFKANFLGARVAQRVMLV